MSKTIKRTAAALARIVSMSDTSTLHKFARLFGTRDNSIGLATFSERYIIEYAKYFARRDILKTLKCDEKTLKRYALKSIENSALKRETKNAMSEHAQALAKRLDVESRYNSSRVLAVICYAMLVAQRNDKSKRASKSTSKTQSVETQSVEA